MQRPSSTYRTDNQIKQKPEAITLSSYFQCFHIKQIFANGYPYLILLLIMVCSRRFVNMAGMDLAFLSLIFLYHATSMHAILCDQYGLDIEKDYTEHSQAYRKYVFRYYGALALTSSLITFKVHYSLLQALQAAFVSIILMLIFSLYNGGWRMLGINEEVGIRFSWIMFPFFIMVSVSFGTCILAILSVLVPGVLFFLVMYIHYATRLGAFDFPREHVVRQEQATDLLRTFLFR